MSTPSTPHTPDELAAMVGPEGVDPAQPATPLGAGAGAAAEAPEGAPPFLNRRLSIAAWDRYVADYVFGALAPSRLVLHHTWSPTEAQWRGLSTMRGMQRYYASKGWTAAPHIYAAPDGIWLATPMARIGIHAGAGNGSLAAGWYSIGLEMVGDFDQARPTGAVWANALAVMAGLSQRLQIAPRQLIAFHHDYSAKSCPGHAVTKEWAWGQVEEALLARAARTYVTLRAVHVHEAPDLAAPIAWGGTCQMPAGLYYDLAPVPGRPDWLHWAAGGFVPAAAVAPLAPAVFTAEAPILAAWDGDPVAVIAAFAQRCASAGSPYAAEPERPIAVTIGPAYARTCAAAGVALPLVLAQVGHESDWLKAALAQRRDRDGRDLRNPAGIGVYEPAAQATSYPRPGTVYDADAGGYRPAVGFARWAPDAVEAHVGRLLAYALPVGQGTMEQQRLIAAAERARPFPAAFRGSARTWKELGRAHNPMGSAGAGWASPGTDYGSRIAAAATALVGAR